jgi:Small acidic protein family
VEQEESKRIEIEVNLAERRRAMEVCAKLGFTLDNVKEVDDIKPKALGMKGQEVDFDILEIGDRPSELRVKDEKRAREMEGAAKGNRVDLGKVADESKAKVFTSDGATPAGLEGDFVSLDFSGGAGFGQQFEALNYNHKLRRKLHRAIEAAQIQKELLVRAKAKEYCESNGFEVPPELATEYKPIKLSGKRILEDGTLETEKQERVRKRLELAEYNKAAKVLRQQAKAEAIEAGLRVFAELTGKKPIDSNEANGIHPPQVGDPKPAGITGDTVEHDDKSKSQSSKKRRQEIEDLDNQKVKKTKTSSAPLGEVEARVENAEKHSTNEAAVPEVKSKTKKRKTSHDQDEGDDPNQVDDAARKKRLKYDKAAPEANAKKSKSKRHKLDPAEPSSTDGRDSSNYFTKARETVKEGDIKNGKQWNPDALNGDAARKDKFLRLLGASKVNGNDTEKPKKVKGKAKEMIEQVEDELERQFEAGIRMKNGQRKKGLGA